MRRISHELMKPFWSKLLKSALEYLVCLFRFHRTLKKKRTPCMSFFNGTNLIATLLLGLKPKIDYAQVASQKRMKVENVLEEG